MFAMDDPFKLTLSILFMDSESCSACASCQVGFGAPAFLQFSETFPIHHSELETGMADGTVGHLNACPG